MSVEAEIDAALNALLDDAEAELGRPLDDAETEAIIDGALAGLDDEEADESAVPECDGPECEPLAIPDVRQTTSFSCGAAALASVLQFFGVDGGEGELVKLLGTDSADGTDPEALAAVAERVGLNATPWHKMTLDDLGYQTSQGRPVICAVQAYGTAKEMREGESGHYVVVRGVTPEDVLIQDPVDGPLSIPRDKFLSGWYDEGDGEARYTRWGLVVGKADG